MLPPVTRLNTDAAADAGPLPLPAQGQPGDAAEPFATLLAIAPPPAAGGTGLPPGGKGLPAPTGPEPGTAAPTLAEPLAVTIAAELPERAALPPGAATAEVAAAELPPPALPAVDTGLAALERMQPAPAAAALPADPGRPAAPVVTTPSLPVTPAAVRRRAAVPPPVVSGRAPVGEAGPQPAGTPAAPTLPQAVDPLVQVRDGAGRSGFIPGEALRVAVARAAAGAEPAAVVEVPRAEPDAAAFRSGLPLAAVGPSAATPSAVTPAAPSLPQAAIPLPVADAAWGDALAERVLLLAGQRLQSAEIRLNPAELGPLRVEIRLEDGAAQVNFTAQHAVTRDAIEQALPRLRELFAGEGLSLAGTSVSEQGLRHERDGRAPASAESASASAEAADDDAVELSLPRREGGRGLVDTFA